VVSQARRVIAPGTEAVVSVRHFNGEKRVLPTPDAVQRR
jgi:hypothetical protein